MKIKVLDEVKIIDFEWDKGNKTKNQVKHDVEIKECEEIFYDKPLYLYDIEHSIIEKRWYIFGETVKKRPLIISFTIRNSKVRVISARNQDRKEKKFYIDNLSIVLNL